MTPRSSLVSLLATLFLSAIAAPAAPQSPPTFSAETSAVVIDVVVRDKSGHVVRDLTRDDFEIREDGVGQAIESMQVISRNPVPSAARPAATDVASSPVPASAVVDDPSDPSASPAVVTLVFDRLSPEAREVARHAAAEYAESVHQVGDVVGVFTIGHALRAVEEFTSDPVRIREGIERAAMMVYTEPADRSTRAEARELIDSIGRAQDNLHLVAERGASSNLELSEIASALAIQQKDLAIRRAEERLERDRQGFATTRALRAIVGGLSKVRGRKTVVLFSEGLAIPSAVEGSFRDVIDAANRSNVSVYTVDAAGLRTESPIQEMRSEIERALKQRRDQRSGGPLDGSLIRDLERNEDVLRYAPEATLGPLARETGGVFIANTNDMGRRFHEMAEDMHFHYILSYSSSNKSYDGRFRRVSVKVRRRGLDVRSRNGYVARPPATPRPAGDPTIRALAALDRDPRPDAFPVAVRALSFPEDERPGLVPIFVEVPSDGISHGLGDDGRLRGDLTILVRVRDEARRDRVVLHQRYRPYASDPRVVEASAQESLLFSPQANLPPGRYTLEVVGYDAISDAASVRAESFDVPELEPSALRLSSLVLAEGARKLDGTVAPGHPLAFGDELLQPRLDATVHKSTTPSLGFFFVAYEGQEDIPASADLEVWRGNDKVEELTLPLEPADADGRVRQAGTLPLDPLAPGHYTLRVALADGSRSAHTQTGFDLAE